MSTKKFIYIANWKMQFSFLQSIDFVNTYYNDFIRLSQKEHRGIVICPSTEALYSIAKIFQGSAVGIGAQTCASSVQGSYTGQISVQSIYELGCTHVLVGHSEQRGHTIETNRDWADKVMLVLSYNMIPIFCIGESFTDYREGTRQVILEQQLRPLFSVLTERIDIIMQKIVYIAYEPTWAIGSNKIPDLAELQEVYRTIHTWAQEWQLDQYLRFLYGGSVTELNRNDLTNVEILDGFLIGGASLNFQKFQNIVS